MILGAMRAAMPLPPSSSDPWLLLQEILIIDDREQGPVDGQSNAIGSNALEGLSLMSNQSQLGEEGGFAKRHPLLVFIFLEEDTDVLVEHLF